jgi:hypothetical protein
MKKCKNVHTFAHIFTLLARPNLFMHKMCKNMKKHVFSCFLQKMTKMTKTRSDHFSSPPKGGTQNVCIFWIYFSCTKHKKSIPLFIGFIIFFWCFWDDFFSLLHLNDENSPIKWQKKCPGIRDPFFLGLDLGHISFLSNTDVLFFNKPRLIFLCFETCFFHVFDVWWFFFITKKWWKKTEANFTFQKWLFTFSHFLPKSSKMIKLLIHFIKK